LLHEHLHSPYGPEAKVTCIGEETGWATGDDNIGDYSALTKSGQIDPWTFRGI
jgi:hypothetical protein